MTDTPPEPKTLRLGDAPLLPAGRALGLRAGDVLVAVNGRAFLGDAPALVRTLGDGRAAMALTFQRGGAEFTVLARSAALGRWEAVAAPPDDAARRRIDPAFLREWEILRAGDGSYDLYPRSLPVTGLALPQLWLLQQRLWLPCATMVAAVVAGFIVHPLAALAVQVAGSVHLRWAHLPYLRHDRLGRGLGLHMVIAARSEGAAHAAHRALHGSDRYLFAPQPKTAETVPA